MNHVITVYSGGSGGIQRRYAVRRLRRRDFVILGTHSLVESHDFVVLGTHSLVESQDFVILGTHSLVESQDFVILGTHSLGIKFLDINVIKSKINRHPFFYPGKKNGFISSGILSSAAGAGGACGASGAAGAGGAAGASAFPADHPFTHPPPSEIRGHHPTGTCKTAVWAGQPCVLATLQLTVHARVLIVGARNCCGSMS